MYTNTKVQTFKAVNFKPSVPFKLYAFLYKHLRFRRKLLPHMHVTTNFIVAYLSGCSSARTFPHRRAKRPEPVRASAFPTFYQTTIQLDTFKQSLYATVINFGAQRGARMFTKLNNSFWQQKFKFIFLMIMVYSVCLNFSLLFSDLNSLVFIFLRISLSIQFNFNGINYSIEAVMPSKITGY